MRSGNLVMTLHRPSAWIIGIFCGVGLGGAQDARGEDSLPQRRTWVIIAAVESYAQPGLGPIDQHAQAARALASFVTGSSSILLRGGKIVTLIGGPTAGDQAPTADNLRRAFAAVARESRPDDTLLFCFAARATPTELELRWLPADASADKPAATTLLASELSELVASTRCRHVLSIIDPVTEKTQWDPPSREPRAAWDTLSGSRELAMPGWIVVRRSPEPTSNAPPQIFETLVEGLGGRADTDGGEPDGWISAQELTQYLQSVTPGNVPLGNAETFWIARHPSPPADINNRKKGLKRKQIEGQLDESATLIGLQLLDRMPRFVDDRDLRQAYINLVTGKINADELNAKRRQVLTRRNLPEGEATAFARLVKESVELVMRRHIFADQTKPAFANGLLDLADSFELADNPAIREEISTLVHLPAAEWETALARFRLRLAHRPEVTQPAAEICLKGMLRTLDPYSSFLTTPVYRAMQAQSSGRFTGIGAILQEQPSAAWLAVLFPLPGGPADKAGMGSGDRIVAVDGVSVADIGAEEASRRLDGEIGSTIELTIESSPNQPRNITVARQAIELESVSGWHRDEDGAWSYWLNRAEGIGYVRISRFAEDTADRLRRAVFALERGGVKSLILDLRFNPGGLVSSAVAVADLFLASGTIVRIHDATGLEQIELARKFGTIEDLALTVLINGSSASGSEIVAAALQDAGRARIAGSRSFGKGSVQTIVPLQKTEAAIKITSAMFDRPSGDNLDRYLGRRLSSDEVWGVRPAKELDVPMYAEENGRLHMQLLERQLRGRLDKELPLDPQLARVQQDLLGRQKRSPAGTSGQSPAE